MYREFSIISCKVTGQRRERIPDSGASKKLLGFFIESLIKVANPLPETDINHLYKLPCCRDGPSGL
jgi:hypothetical protein